MILKYLSFDPASIFSLGTFKLIFDKREQNTNKVGSQKSRILFSFSKSNLKFSYSRLFLGGVFPLTLSNVATSSYPGWIKSPHVVTLGILKFSGGEGGIPE